MTFDTFSLSQSLAEFAVGVPSADLPEAIRDDATWRLVDTLGVAIAGSRMDFAEPVTAMARATGGVAEATTLVAGDRLPAQLAAFVNGCLAHGQDFDDTHSVALVHPSCVALPAALAMAERAGASGADFLSAAVIGAEVGLRIGIAGRSSLIDRGFHATSVTGTFIAAAAASRLLGLPADLAANALGLAGSFSSGLFQGMLDGSWVKRIHPGIACQGGITAALLAERGFTGPVEVLEGRYGLYATFLHGDGSVDPGVVLAGLGERWHYTETTFKPYPTGSVSHTTMGAVAQLMREGGLVATDIESVDCEVPSAVIPIMCEPRETRLNPATPYHMKFSLPYATAILILTGSVAVDDFTEANRIDPAIRAMAERVHFKADPGMSTEGFPGRIAITTVAGQRLKLEVKAQRGSPGNPMEPAEHRDKFLANASPTLGETQAEKLLAALESCWEAPDVSELTALLVAELR